MRRNIMFDGKDIFSARYRTKKAGNPVAQAISSAPNHGRKSERVLFAIKPVAKKY